MNTPQSSKIEHLETGLQHAGAEHRVGRGLISAVETSVTFLPDERGSVPIYARLSNTKNHREAEAMIAHIEHAEASAVFASGMAAMSAFCFSFLKPGDHMVCQENSYGGNNGLLTKVMKRWGVETTFAPIERWHECFQSNTRAVYFESISNPFCIPQDIKRAIGLAKQHNALSICDNTFASPYNCLPIRLGTDFVLESGTKYLNGHSDVVCGTLASSQAHIQKINETAMYLGGFLSTTMTSQLLRGLRTFAVRMQAHNQNGERFASRMRALKDVHTVYYATPHEHIAENFKPGFGGMCTVRFASHVDVYKLMDSLEFVTDVPSLGGTETTGCLPIDTTNHWMKPPELEKLGIDHKLVRFSIGIENIDDLMKDIERALKIATTSNA